MDIKDFKGHIFDLDGTLTKSNHVWSKIDEEFLGKRGIKVPEDYFKQVSAMNFEQAAVYTNDRFSLGENIQDIMKEWFDMAVYEYTNVIELCGNAGEYVRKLKEQGRKIALATASTEELYKPVLKKMAFWINLIASCLQSRWRGERAFLMFMSWRLKNWGLKQRLAWSMRISLRA